MQHQEVRASRVLSILARDPWCIKLLTTVAGHKNRNKSDLLLLERSDLGRISDTELQRSLSLLTTARMIEIDGELVMVTPMGAEAITYSTNDLSMDRSATIGLAPSEPGDFEVSSVSETVAENLAVQAVLPTVLDQPNPSRPSIPHESENKLHAENPSLASGNSQVPFYRRSNRDAAGRSRVAANFSAKFLVSALIIFVSVLLIVGWYYVPAQLWPKTTNYRFATVQRAGLVVSMLATGQVRAIDAVEVSSQLSGQVIELFASFNDEVKAGAPLAQLDDKIFQATVAEARARVAHAEASHDSAVAATTGTEARFTAAQQDFERKQSLAKKGDISRLEVEKTQAVLLTAESEHKAAIAHESVQRATIDMAKATLRRAEIDLERTSIRSPIDGVIIRRSVELGQTVAASMEAPTLFTIAQELSEMQVHARVDEADIGQIRTGQKSSFSVDAYPGQTFSGQVVEIRRAPESVQNVVTYTVVITAKNPKLSLLPGMTALVQIVTVERSNALLVPNAALRFEPVTLEASNRSGGSASSMEQGHRIWVRNESNSLTREVIGLGATDGAVTEVVSGSVVEGQQIAVGAQLVKNEKTLFGLRLGF